MIFDLHPSPAEQTLARLRASLLADIVAADGPGADRRRQDDPRRGNRRRALEQGQTGAVRGSVPQPGRPDRRRSSPRRASPASASCRRRHPAHRCRAAGPGRLVADAAAAPACRRPTSSSSTRRTAGSASSATGWHAGLAGVPFVGLSATPWTERARQALDHLIVAATTAELIDKGFLSPFRVFAPAHPDLSGVSGSSPATSMRLSSRRR